MAFYPKRLRKNAASGCSHQWCDQLPELTRAGHNYVWCMNSVILVSLMD